MIQPLSLKKSAYTALLRGARRASPDVSYSESGYAATWKQNLHPDLPLQEIEHDLCCGAGQELSGKLLAAHSSSALAINVFGRWRQDCSDLTLEGVQGAQSLRFEAQCSTGLKGTPPHLDVLIEGSTLVAVESKCTEWMSPKNATFSPAYDSLLARLGHTSWFALLLRLRLEPAQFRFLDAAQLVKHALGLMTCYPRRAVRLLYVFWEPLNASEWPECQVHRAEIDRLRSLTKDSAIELHSASYTDVLTSLAPSLRHGHLQYLETRYLLTVTRF